LATDTVGDSTSGSETAGPETSTGETVGGDGDGDGETGDGDGDGDGESGDGDGDPIPLGPCTWTAVPAQECTTTFEPAPAVEPPPLVEADYSSIAGVDIIARADHVEVAWIRQDHDDFDDYALEARYYLASNVQGLWQHQFLMNYECSSDICPPETLQIQGSSMRTQIAPPYLRRDGAEWQVPVVDFEADPLTEGVYIRAKYFAVAPDDRSYLVNAAWTPDLPAWWVWAETDAGCHAPAWLLEINECRPTSVLAAAVDDAGVLHMTGSELVSEDDYRLVHWTVGADQVERTEIAPFEAGTMWWDQSLAIGPSGELHLCLETNEIDPAAIYAHGHDSNDWTSIPIEDPDAGLVDNEDQGYCKVALSADGIPWFVWHGGQSGAMDPLRVASLVDGILNYEVVDMGAKEAYAQITVDPMGRPWMAYRPFNSQLYFKVAHKDGDEWIVESIYPL
jgi:hypothetical protein